MASLVLSSCNAAEVNSNTWCDGGAAAGDASNAVSVTGDFSKVLRVDMPTPLKPAQTERTQLITGHGPLVPQGAVVSVALTVLNGTTGEIIQAYNGNADSMVVFGKNLLPGFAKSLKCTTVGSRIVSVVTPDDAFGTQGGNASLKIGKNDSLIFVIDVKSASLARADGIDQVPTPGFPAVVLNQDGIPGITITKKNAPTSLEVEVLKKGNGAEVTADTTVTVQFTSVSWATRTVIESSWASGDPIRWVVADKATNPRGIAPHLVTALVGQRVGSQFVAQFPTFPAGTAVVYVVDVLAVSS